jgi:alpha-galactosidase
MSIQVAIIGAGSLGFTRTLVRDILGVPEFADTRFRFTDIDPVNLDRAVQLCRKDVADSRLPAKFTGTPNRRKAIEGADYVINCTRIGGLKAFTTDIEIPLKYGVDQCVGDTLCVGGIMYGQRGIAAMLDFCRDVREVASADALLLNYGNPNVMLTWAANAFGGVNTVGLCHGVHAGHWQIAKVIELLVNKGRKPGSRGFTPVEQKDVDIICAGINHQTWYIQARYRGEDWTGRLLEGFEKHPTFSKNEPCRIDVLRRTGYYSTESNGHLSEYLPWYRKNPARTARWIDPNSWIGGETGGYLRICIEGRNDFDRNFGKWLKAPPNPITPAARSHEHGSHIIEALETGRTYRGHFIVPNRGCISNLPDDCMVEVPGYCDRNGMSIPRVGDLPLACAAILSSSVNVQRMAVHAAVTGDVTLLKQAVMNDPLTGAVCEPEDVWQMVDEMLVAQAAWLPQYRLDIPAAKRRLAAAHRSGDYRGTKKFKGVLRRKVAPAR